MAPFQSSHLTLGRNEAAGPEKPNNTNYLSSYAMRAKNAHRARLFIFDSSGHGASNVVQASECELGGLDEVGTFPVMASLPPQRQIKSLLSLFSIYKTRRDMTRSSKLDLDHIFLLYYIFMVINI
jgi:hypothetical protein